MITGVFTVMICLFIFAFLKFIYNVQRDRLLSRRLNKHSDSDSCPRIRIIHSKDMATDEGNETGQPFPGTEKPSLN